ncbi:NAD(P)/FAD-dependent oxidoreductase [Paenarthrobacter ilicis]|uniref:NAD(P)/FAD-dependent oxidoreductase n=1 Tax=Paenarthrobacter ilicis TaxID=43665 RepID=UPI0028D038B9|nr:NAD(P)/FAD-dependent oxidoreductase [Paenarthrobacter ilicis]
MVTWKSNLPLIIIGGGPAGMSAAAAALRADPDVDVILIDGNRALGGQYWRQPVDERLSEATSKHLHHLSSYRRLRDELQSAQSAGRLSLMMGSWVWTVTRDDHGTFTAQIAGDQASTSVRGSRVIICAGAFDRQLPFPGWDLPGVVTAGGAQALLKTNDVTVGSRVAIGGTGPFLVAVATGLAEAGATIVGVHEANSYGGWGRHAGNLAANPSKLIEGAELGYLVAKHRIPIRPRTAIIRAIGTDRVKAVTTARLNRFGRVISGSEKTVPVDAVAVGWGFTAQIELAITLGAHTRVDTDGSQVVVTDNMQASSVEGLYVAGEVSGVGGLESALVEGEIAGASAVGATSGKHSISRRRRVNGFAQAMHHAHPVTDHWQNQLSDETIICRCEEVTYDRLSDTVTDPITGDPRSAKLATRAGMGWCQGRMCGYAVSCLSANASATTTDAFAKRPVASPVTLGSLAASSGPNE